jgi:hypothetical protein
VLIAFSSLLSSVFCINGFDVLSSAGWWAPNSRLKQCLVVAQAKWAWIVSGMFVGQGEYTFLSLLGMHIMTHQISSLYPGHTICCLLSAPMQQKMAG